jgi:pyruvate,water dikinase
LNPGGGARGIIWTRRFVGERWAFPLTPLSSSLMLEWFVGEFLHSEYFAERLAGGAPPVRLYRGYAYLNASMFANLLPELGIPIPEFFRNLFPPGLSSLRRGRISPRHWEVLVRTLWRKRFWRMIELRPLANRRCWRRFAPAYVARIRAIQDDAIRWSDPGLLRGRLGEAVRLLGAYRRLHLGSLALASLFYLLAEQLVMLGRSAEDSVGLEEVAQPREWTPTLGVNRDLARLAEHLDRCPLSVDRLAALDRRELRRCLEEEALGLFGEAFERFLLRHGHRCDNSYDLAEPSWREAPELPLRRVLAFAGFPGTTDGLHPPVGRAFRRRWLDAMIPAWRRSPRGRALDIVLALLADYLLLREEQRYVFDLHIELIKRLLAVADRVIAERAGGSPGDVHFLTWEQLDSFLKGSLRPSQARELIQRARAQHEEFLRAPPPPTFLRDDEPLDPSPPSLRSWRGFGISPGRASGPAVIIADPAQAPPLSGKEVLVVRGLDPGWTALFPAAAGIVMELGGLLSHGALIARELGIPAVSGIDGATERIRPGQIVTLDGDSGRLSVDDASA